VNLFGEHHHILLVDDEPWYAEALRIALQSEGFTCDTATDMSAAMAFLRKHLVSVVVTDIMMPPGPDFASIDSSETGYHLIKMVQGQWPSVRIICLSVIGDQKKILALKRQRVQYLRKGEVSLEDTLKCIRRAATGTIRF
jgi:DNA-binding response OmpR family regulator